VTIRLENAALRLDCLPALGGRIVALIDRVTGRNWLTTGHPSTDPGAWAGQDAIFGGDQAFGWDECLPTIARCPDPLDPSGPPLRDHGDAWGRSAEVERRGDDALVSRSSVGGRWELTRTIRLADRTVAVDYDLRSLGPAVPFLWSMHPLLALEPGSRVELSGLDRIGLRSSTEIEFATDEAGTVGWPIATATDGTKIDLALVHDAGAGFAVKLATNVAPAGAIGVRTPDGAAIHVDWKRAVAPAVGIWLDHGGWPEGAALRQVAIEPATSGDEDLVSAVMAGRARLVPVGGNIRWWARLEVAPPPGADG
jgi:hypothetical protein